ncbi:MAG: family 20 glycosylhydrolase [Clostridia bacterium]|nr:family 20 glycosylhydrolase [Clostridia bacterium]
MIRKDDTMFFDPKTTVKKEGTYCFGTQVRAVADPMLCTNLFEELWKGFCQQQSEITLLPGEKNRFLLGDAPFPILSETDEYALNITEMGIGLVAKNYRGLVHGLFTLLGSLDMRQIRKGIFTVPCGEIHDAPLVKDRMVHLCVFPETSLDMLRGYIRYCGGLKFTHLIVEFWGTYRYECAPYLAWREHSFSKEELLPLFEEARAMGMEIIPMFNHLGHASQSRGGGGKHTTLDQHPEYADLFEPDGWAWDIQNPETQELLRMVREEQISLCGDARYFHLGFDEVYTYTSSAEKINDLLRFLNKTASELLDRGITPIIWGDMLFAKGTFPEENGRYSLNLKTKALSDQILNGLDKRIVIADWQYHIKKEPVLSSLELKKRGFQVLSCPWFDKDNIRAVIRSAVQNQLEGVICTTWHTMEDGFYTLLLSAKELWEGENDWPNGRLRAEAATLLRKMTPPCRPYAECGWMQNQMPWHA